MFKWEINYFFLLFSLKFIPQNEGLNEINYFNLFKYLQNLKNSKKNPHLDYSYY